MGKIKFSIYQTPAHNGRKQKPYARPILNGTKRMEEICHLLSDSCSITSSDIKAVLEALGQYIGRELANGYSVELEGLGHFSPSLRCTQGKDDKGKERCTIRVHGVNFRCANSLKERVKQNQLQAIKRRNLPNTDRDGRKKKMLEYLQNHPSINVSAYALLNSCTYYASQNDIRQFLADGIIRSIGYRTHRIYLLAKAE